MCLGVPLKVIKILNQDKAIVSMGESFLEINTVFTPEIKEGDYVIVHAGFSISILSNEDTEEINSLLNELKNGKE
ncbi:MAG: HypC/HybG/HupF family hydrogenase formation chaperone [Caldisericia bacterium]|nr:HypC/HybG/HupF family hydrogenase formation chaperone [Caldisericia bacterium]